MPRLFLCALLAVVLSAFAAVPAVAQDPVDPDTTDETWADDAWTDDVGDDVDPVSDTEQAEPDPDGWDGPEDPSGDSGDWWPDDEPEVEEIPLVTTPTVAGRVAMLRTNGKAAIPRSAPARVRAIIAAGNRIVGKPYKWGGGHARLDDRGYDCSGTVGYALIKAHLLYGPMVSGQFARWGTAGAGHYVTVYANKGHVYMEVAGLRLDTSTAGDRAGGTGPRWRPVIGKRPHYKVRHPAGL